MCSNVEFRKMKRCITHVDFNALWALSSVQRFESTVQRFIHKVATTQNSIRNMHMLALLLTAPAMAEHPIKLFFSTKTSLLTSIEWKKRWKGRNVSLTPHNTRTKKKFCSFFNFLFHKFLSHLCTPYFLYYIILRIGLKSFHTHHI